MKDFDEKRGEIFRRAEQMRAKRKARVRTALILTLLVALLAGAVITVAATRKNDEKAPDESVGTALSADTGATLPTKEQVQEGREEPSGAVESIPPEGSAAVGHSAEPTPTPPQMTSPTPTPTPPSAETPVEMQTPLEEPPFSVSFSSLEEYNAFCSMAEKTDEEIAAYLKEKSFYLYVCGKEDILRVQSEIDDLYNVRLLTDEIELCLIDYRIDDGFLKISYPTKGTTSFDDGYSDLFWVCSSRSSKETIASFEERCDKEHPLTIDGYLFYPAKAFGNTYFGVIDQDCLVRFTYYGDHEDALEQMLQEWFAFEKISVLRESK